MNRGISNLLAILILVSIVIGIAIAVSTMTTTYVQKIKPKGSTLSILSVKAYPVTEDRKYILVEITVSVTGTEDVQISSIGLYWEYSGRGTSAYVDPLKPEKNKWFPPGSMINILAYFTNLRNPPEEKAPLRVVVEYCTKTGCHRTSASTILEPYKQ